MTSLAKTQALFILTLPKKTAKNGYVGGARSRTITNLTSKKEP
jgi:hypothetical protein